MLKRILTAPLLFVAAIVILLEDWLWDDLQRLAAWFSRLPLFRQLESAILRLPPTGALVLFLVPSAVLFPVKLLALALVSRGYALLGIGTIVAAKVFGTALLARLFRLTKPKLLTFFWFRHLYEWLVAFRVRIYSAIKASTVYKVTHQYARRWRTAFRAWRDRRKGWLRKRWGAVRRHQRRVKHR